MRAVVQKVLKGSVSVSGNVVGNIEEGLVVFLGVSKEDTLSDACYLAEKIANLRIFTDDEEKMNLSVLDTNGEILVISQFTLFGDCRKGRRPSFTEAAYPDVARKLYDDFVSCLLEKGLTVKTGVFQSHMVIGIENDGPVTMLLDSKKVF
ncbi:MAG: D-aminoacyl-tRNA deacylase [Bacillota bacterium]|jgi:D-tyrosyl-tRNA(Tyr) deacylase